MIKLIKRLFCRIGYVHICNSENIVADRAAFRDIYTGIAKRAEQKKRLPVGIMQAERLLIGNIGGEEGWMT